VAIPYFLEAVRINPQYAQGWFNLGKTYDLIGKKDSAVYALKQSIRSDSTYVQPYAELARIYAGNKDSAAALGLLRTAISFKPESEFLWKNMATTCLAFGDSTGWVSALEVAAKINPNDVQRLYVLADYFSRKKDVTKAAYYANLEAEALERQNIPREEEK
jgi:tetratricopeptide (TPR) repeat protein